jgi:hypothetical protein
MNLTDALSPRAMFEFLARFLCSGTMYEYKLIAIYMKKIEVECEAGCEDKQPITRCLCFSITSRLVTRKTKTA